MEDGELRSTSSHPSASVRTGPHPSLARVGRYSRRSQLSKENLCEACGDALAQQHGMSSLRSCCHMSSSYAYSWLTKSYRSSSSLNMTLQGAEKEKRGIKRPVPDIAAASRISAYNLRTCTPHEKGNRLSGETGGQTSCRKPLRST